MTSAAAVSPDDQWLVTSTANDEVLRWDTSVVGGEPETLRPKSEKPAQFNIRGLTFSEDGSTLTYFDHGDDAFHVLDVEAGEELHSYAPGAAEFALAPDGVTVAWADRETNAVYLADVTSADAPVKLLDVPENLDVAPNITSLAFTSDGKQLIVGGFHERDEQNEIYVITLK
jgi:WD40 repeat protein